MGLEALRGACTVERTMKRLEGVPKRGPIGRAVDRFLANPSSGRNAILLIVIANLATVVVAGVAIWLLDRRDFEHLTEAFWYILQTVTTVGYGDVTPIDPVGRWVGAGVMLLGIAFTSILTATITSSLVEARQAERRAKKEAEQDEYQTRVEARLDTIIERLDRIESAEAQSEGSDPP
jgi:voltage-gated potassium channel Kch